MTQAANALTEITDNLSEITPQFEGFRDFASLNLQGVTRDVVMERLETYNRRSGLLARARDALQKLLDDGYPEIPVQVVSTEVFADLQDNVRTISAAFTKVTGPNPASNLNLTPGAPENK